ncbi:SpvB/TcaC N-terminal domain-containing protein [Epilithonimonas zeae]|uniref:SpvB/TcaC N-terminal domain-containing protein n=1 Tax=Epilithonimonas zeae TaxID=1416779 RepID=UPI00200FE32E|nr:SpvB/TcaC N-terminal domain-containing protein [Epilithonimonas zeae]UQB68882.1 hypothetical protein KI430_00085 [Epilithonimonas zeae]
MKPNIFSYIRNQKKLVRFVIFFISWSQVYGYSYANYFSRKGNTSTKRYNPIYVSDNSNNILKSGTDKISRSNKGQELNSSIALRHQENIRKSITANPASVVYFNSDIKEGIIGKDKNSPVDQVFDNVFNISIDELPKNGTVTLEYDLFGVSDYSGVSKVINDDRFSGGLNIQHTQNWTHQSELINSGTLIKGLNTVLFTISPDANYAYKVKNVRFKITTSKNIITSDNNLNTLLSGTITKEFFKGQSQNFSIGNAGLETLEGSIAYNTVFSITPLEILDIPAIAPEMVNVTSEKAGYRFLPHGQHFQTPAKVSLGFDKNKIPSGYTENDIKTYFFDRASKKWIALEKDSLISDKQILVSKTTHFTDMINGIIKVPESPETGSYAPNSIKDIKAADPVSGIVSIAAPSPNSQGSVTTSFPIKLPAGRQGMQPSLSVNYNSDGGNGWLGMGWDLSIPAISIDSRWGVPRYDSAKETEIYTIAGEQLTFKDGNNYVMPNRNEGFDKNRLPDGTQFYPRIEGAYNKIIRHGNSPSTYWWEVISKDGTRSFFGGDGINIVENAVLRQPSTNNIGHWALYKTIDRNGNYTEYFYNNNVYSGSPGNGGKEIYLDEIHYAKHDAAPTAYYRIKFTSENRTDTRIDARLGFVQVNSKRLKNITIRAGRIPIVRSYDFSYKTDNQSPFYKSLLEAITEKDAEGSVFYTNKLEYNQLPNTLYTPETVINSGTDNISDASVINAGKSKNNSFGFAATFGLILKTSLESHIPTLKSGTIGANYQYGESGNEGKLTLVDVNGDGLPDKVFNKKNRISFRNNNSTINTLSFGDSSDISGSTLFDIGKTYTNTIGLELTGSTADIISVHGGWSRSTQRSITKNYFEDVNSDGIPDLVEDGVVKFGKIDSGTGELSYTVNSAETPNPIVVGNPIGTIVTPNSDEEKELREQSPLLDIVKVWKAPYSGVVNINGIAKLLQSPVSPEDGVNIMVQQGSVELTRFTLNASALQQSFSYTNRIVNRGDYIYFRASSVENGNKDDVQFQDFSISYISLKRANGTTVSIPTVKTDENKMDLYTFSVKNDYLFTSSSANGVPFDGQAKISGLLQAPPLLTDDIRLEVLKNGVNVPGSPVIIPQSAVNSITDINSLIPIFSVNMSDDVRVVLASATNIDWKFTNTNDVKIVFTETLSGQTVTKYPIINKAFYNWVKKGDTTDIVVPGYPYVGSMTGNVYPYLRFADPFTPITGKYTFSIKQYDNNNNLKGVYSKTVLLSNFTNPSGIYDGSIEDPLNSAIIINNPQANDVVYISFYADNDGTNVQEKRKNNEAFVTRTLEARAKIPSVGGLVPGNIYIPDYDDIINPDTQQTDMATDGRFGPMYRNWGQFLYNGGWGNYANGNPNWDQLPIDTSVLVEDTTSYDQNNPSPPIYQKRWFSLAPYYGVDPDDESSTPAIIQRYQGNNSKIYVQLDNLGTSRMGAADIASLLGSISPVAGTGASAPRKIVKSISNSTTIGAGIGVFSLNHANSAGLTNETKTVVNYLDMNGDGYPDPVGDNIQYTNSLGGYSAVTGNIPDGSQSLQKHKMTGFSQGASVPVSFASGGIVTKSQKYETQTNDGRKVTLSVPMEILTATPGLNIGIGQDNNDDDGAYDFTDINGDGLPDKIYKNGDVSLNLGYKFGPSEIWFSDGKGYREGKSQTNSLSGGVSINGELNTLGGVMIGNGSIGFGMSGNKTESNQITYMQDINGDGLTDKIINSGGGTLLYLNTGNGFVQYNWNGLSNVSESVSKGKSSNIAVSVCPIIITPTPATPDIKICLNPSYSWGTGQSNITRQITDINGDGFPDILSSESENELKTYISTIGTTNLLKKVTLPTGGSWEVTYERKGNSYEMPQSRYVMSSVVVKDGFAQDDQFKPGVSKITVAYEKPYHSRRERTFYGFNEVRINEINTANGGANATQPFRYTIQHFNNNSYYLKGVLLDETLYAYSGNTKWTEKINEFSLRKIHDANMLEAINITRNGNYITVNYLQKDDEEKTAFNYAYFVATDKNISKFYEGQTAPGKKTQTEVKSYNNYGDILKYTDGGDLDIGGTETLTTDIDYQINNNGSNYMILPTTVSSAATGVSRARTASYDANGNLKTLTMTGGGNPEYKYDYDVYGNIQKATLPQNANGERFWHQYTYDDGFFTYPIKVQDAFGYSSTTEYDYRFGLPTFTIDMNLQPTQYTYDAKGRLATVTGPYELFNEIPWTIQMEYNPVTNAPLNATTAQSYAVTRHYDPEITGNTINTISIADGLGAAIQLKKSAEIYYDGFAPLDPQYIVSGKVQQDAFGRTLKTYYPTVGSTNIYLYDPAVDTVEPTINTYDVMDRVLTTKLPGEQLFSKVQYDFGTDRLGRPMFHTKFTDELGSIKHNFVDIKGRTTTVHEESNTGDIVTSFTHDAIGQLIEVKDVENHLTTSVYDDLGRRTSMTQPDNGTSTFTYDPAGNLTSKTTAENEIVTYQYDYNRLKSISYPNYPENNVAYYYGAAQNASAADENAVGRLWYQTDATGTQRLKYGKLGELTSQRRSVAVPDAGVFWYGTEWEYDTWNRVKNITYPDGEKVTYHYNTAGNLSAMDSEKDGFYKRYVNQIGYDKFEQRVYLRYGNGTITRYEYENERRRLLKMNATGGGRAKHTFMDNLYQYDVVSNVLQVHNNAPVAPTGLIGGGTNYAYGYDDLYRLTSASGNWKGKTESGADLRHRYTYTMAYDNMHNVMSKVQKHETAPGNTGNNWTARYNTSYMLNYKYEGDQPHAPSTIIDQPNIVPTTTCCDPNDPGVKFMHYAYDKKGNPTGIDKETCTVTEAATTHIWDEENRLQAVDTNPSTPEADGITMYTYDAGGERVVKQVYAGSYLIRSPFGTIEIPYYEHTIYPNGLVSMNLSFDRRGNTYRRNYTKHYYAGTQRISGALGSSVAVGDFNCNWLIIPFGSGAAPINEKDVTLQKKADAEAHRAAIFEKFGINGADYGQNGGYNEQCATDFSGVEEKDVYWYHPDHLGSSSFITGIDGEVTQNMEYFPSGETFVENHLNSYNVPYKFNAKELDDETGYYYYGARYYNPRISLWLGTDALAGYDPIMNTEHYIDGEHNGGVYNSGNLNPYIYTYQNPLRFIDPNGKQVDVTLFDINKTPGDATLVKAGQKMQYVPNSFTIIAHGNVGYMRDVKQGKKVEGEAGQIRNTKMFDARFNSYKEWNEGKNKKGFNLILYSCNTGGGGENSLPTKLSTDYQKLTVIAPTRQMWSTVNGFVGVYGATEEHKMDKTDPGYWLVFQKGKLVAAYDSTWEPGKSTKGHKVDIKKIPESHYNGPYDKKDIKKK